MWIAVVVLILLCIVSAVFLVRAKKSAWDWMKDWAAPVLTPLTVLLVGFAVQQDVDRRRASEDRLEREMAVMRDVIGSHERQDMAHILAVTWQLVIHLQRWQHAQPTGQAPNASGTAAARAREFDAMAAYFFVGMLRVADVRLEADRGSFVFRRVWMEDRFHKSIHGLLGYVLGGDVRDVSTSAMEEAAQYKYFSRGGSESQPVLWDFCVSMSSTEEAPPEFKVLREGCRRFTSKLQSGQIDVGRVARAQRALRGLYAYAFNDVFAEWYGRKADVPANTFPEVAPAGFLAHEKDRDSLWVVIGRAKP